MQWQSTGSRLSPIGRDTPSLHQSPRGFWSGSLPYHQHRRRTAVSSLLASQYSTAGRPSSSSRRILCFAPFRQPSSTSAHIHGCLAAGPNFCNISVSVLPPNVNYVSTRSPLVTSHCCTQSVPWLHSTHPLSQTAIPIARRKETRFLRLCPVS